MNRLEQLQSMLDDAPDDPFLIYAVAREYEQQQITMQALLMYEHLLQEHPEYTATYLPYARLLFTAGNRTEALALLEKGIERAVSQKDQHTANEMKSQRMTWSGDDEEDE